MCWACAGLVLGMCGACAGLVWGMCGACAGHVLGMCWACAGHVLGMCWACAGYVLGDVLGFGAYVLPGPGLLCSRWSGRARDESSCSDLCCAGRGERGQRRRARRQRQRARALCRRPARRRRRGEAPPGQVRRRAGQCLLFVRRRPARGAEPGGPSALRHPAAACTHPYVRRRRSNLIREGPQPLNQYQGHPFAARSASRSVDAIQV